MECITSILHICCRLLTFSSPSSAAAGDDDDDDGIDRLNAEAGDDGVTAPEISYDVFISFRGDDTRRGIMSHLDMALKEKKIDTYIDERLPRGEEIGGALLEAIQKSKISVIIFSQNYASSTWCLDELVHILKCKKKYRQMVIPLFFGINPSDVRGQLGRYADDFAQHEIRFKKYKVREWRNALAEAADIAGFVSEKYKTDADFVKAVVDYIWTKLSRESPCDLEGLVGFESHIKQFEELLSSQPQDACMTVGIWGEGGSGKTTLADIIFHKLKSEFEACWFLRDITKKEQKDGHLQDTLISKILKEGQPTGSFRVLRKKVLVVLDDVRDSMQIEHLGRNRLRFGNGSRIIITSRNGATLNVDKTYKLEGLNPDDAFQLFCSRAFKKNSTLITDYKELAKEAVSYAGCVPMDLITLGCSFENCKSKEDWEDKLDKLKENSIENIRSVLRRSYYDRWRRNAEGIPSIWVMIERQNL